MTWREALNAYGTGEAGREDEGWLELLHPATGDRMGFAPFDLPSAEELEQLQARGWRVDRPT